MGLLGQTGSDTLTHIVSILFLFGLGIGTVAIESVYHTLDDVQSISLDGAVIVIGLMMAYYSIKYQQTPTGGTIISTDATSVNSKTS